MIGRSNATGGSGSSPTLISKLITQNGTYNASSDNADGYSNVTVLVSGSSGITFKDYAETKGNGNYLFYYNDSLTSAEASVYMNNVDTSVWDEANYMFAYCTSITQSPPMDLSNVTSIEEMFFACSNLTSVYSYNTSNCTRMNGAFAGCDSLTSIPNLDYSNSPMAIGLFNSCNNLTVATFPTGSSFSDTAEMFENCTRLTRVDSFDTSNSFGAQAMFFNCYNLVTIGSLDFSNVINDYLGNMLYNCRSLENIGIYNIKIDWDISASSLFTASALATIINNLGDVASEGRSATLTMSSTSYGLLSQQDIDTATNKGWTIASV